MSSSASLDGQIALVTGASRGIGRAVALALAGEGAEVVVNYASSPDAAEAVVAEIQANGGSAYALQADVADEASVEELFKTVLTRSGRIDVLVNNAGITRDGLLMRMKTEDWQAVINLNLTGVFLCTRACDTPNVEAAEWSHHQHHLGGWADGQRRTSQLRSSQSRRCGTHAKQRQRDGEPGNHGECCCTWLHCHRYDKRS